MTALARSAVRHAALGTPGRDERAAFEADAIAGLTAMPKQIPPKYFYDERGSQLFQQITELPEYYPTRTELAILQNNAAALARLLPAQSTLIEFGTGSTAKARILLEAATQVTTYVPVDISAEFLAGQVLSLQAALPRLSVLPVVADFTGPFELPDAVESGPRIGFFPGSTIGNFEPYQAAAFLRQAAGILGTAATLIVGVDLIKDAEILFDAYNDSRGVTAEFNLNLLARMNRELGADFDLDTFEHHAFYNCELGRIEMHLASVKRQKVRVAGRTIEFRPGETIHTENSYKYTPRSFSALAHGAGWETRTVFTDPAHLFAVHVLAREQPARKTTAS